MLWLIALLIFVAGCLGGLVNSAITGELKLPHRDTEAQVFRPGWIGPVLVGGVVAVASWGINGPLAELELVGPASTTEPTLRLAEFFGAVVIGFGGGRWLTAELGRVMATKEGEALNKTKNSLVEALRTATGGQS